MTTRHMFPEYIMAINSHLLEKARGAEARLVESERQSQLARLEYYALVRRIHLAGASFREIARELSLSHQRVQQIVDGAGGSWWQKVWRSRNAKQDLICTFCQRTEKLVAQLIAGPNVFICNDCVESAEQEITGGV